MPYPVDMSVHPQVTAFFDPDTHTVSYVVQDPASLVCAIIDPVLGIDYAAGRLSRGLADRMIAHVRARAASPSRG